MTITYEGSLSIGGALPGVAGAFEAALPDLQVRLDALATFAPTTPDFAANLSLAQGIVTNLQQAIAFGITPPNLDAQLAEVELAVSGVEASLGAAAALLATLDAAGLYLFTYTGNVEDFGTEFQAEIGSGLPGGGGTGACNAVVMLTKTPATWTALASLLP